MSEQRILAATDEIYGAAAGELPWAQVGRSLSRLVGAGSGWLVRSDSGEGGMELIYRADFQADDIAAYQTRYRSIDLWTTRVAAAVARDGRQAPRTRISGHLVPDAEYTRSPFYAEFGRRLGLRHVIGTVLPLGDAGMMPIGLHRPDGASPFEAEDARLLDRLLPHLQRGMQLRHRLGIAAAATSPGAAALDGLPTPVMVVDGEMTLILANLAAEALASRGSGLRIAPGTRGSGSVRSAVAADCHEDHRALAALVRATALGGSPGGAVRLRDPTLAPTLAALVSPLPRRLCPAPDGRPGRVAGRALILLRDLRAGPPPPDPGLLRELFGLTRTEVEVACALAGGATKGAVAAQRGLQESTIKTQVSAILAKTGAANLRALERLLASLR